MVCRFIFSNDTHQLGCVSIGNHLCRCCTLQRTHTRREREANLGGEGVSSQDGGEQLNRILPHVAALILRPPKHQWQNGLQTRQRNGLETHTDIFQSSLQFFFNCSILNSIMHFNYFIHTACKGLVVHMHMYIDAFMFKNKFFRDH